MNEDNENSSRKVTITDLRALDLPDYSVLNPSNALDNRINRSFIKPQTAGTTVYRKKIHQAIAFNASSPGRNGAYVLVGQRLLTPTEAIGLISTSNDNSSRMDTLKG